MDQAGFENNFQFRKSRSSIRYEYLLRRDSAHANYSYGDAAVSQSIVSAVATLYGVHDSDASASDLHDPQPATHGVHDPQSSAHLLHDSESSAYLLHDSKSAAHGVHAA